MAKTRMWKCSNCGAPNSLSNDVCYNCQFSPSVDQTQVVDNPPPPSPQVPQFQPGSNQPSDPGYVIPPQPARAGIFPVSPRIIITVILALLVVGALVIRTVEIRAAEHKRMEAMHDALSALQAIGSALKVGLNLDDYQTMLIDAQTKIDVYTSKYGWLGFDGVGKRMCAAQQAYKDAASLWAYENKEKADMSELERGMGDYVFIKPNTLMYDVCKRYPGALDNALPGDGIIIAGTIAAEDARQAMWADARIIVEDLATTIGRE